MSRRLLRTTVDGQTCLVEIDRDQATVTPDAAATSTPPAAGAAIRGDDDEAAAALNRSGANHATVSHAEAQDIATAQAPESDAARTFVVTPFDAAVVRVEEEGAPRALDVHTVLDNGIIWAFVDGDVFRVEVEDAERGTRARRGTGDEGLSAPMPATVIKLLVDVGEQVDAGDALLLLEAMKMELPIRAPRAARVKAFRCKAGDLVQPGVPLVDLEST